ncbi:hypothetical protein TRFO_20972 [Tritrichomonas foetus]|uniref:Uncharacterized protein n=1 Tax=Tritrichomonas foetus TaxID=1144522 RepID=A0A1J4KKT0_9EUKA|nr:hypothetical protein TRFO_20972 [Tritrichomonas foetus]|eukprot:OHT09981.1 hypothetical protein TRFO_20972 [Tritrichomonas foetus]
MFLWHFLVFFLLNGSECKATPLNASKNSELLAVDEPKVFDISKSHIFITLSKDLKEFLIETDEKDPASIPIDEKIIIKGETDKYSIFVKTPNKEKIKAKLLLKSVHIDLSEKEDESPIKIKKSSFVQILLSGKVFLKGGKNSPAVSLDAKSSPRLQIKNYKENSKLVAISGSGGAAGIGTCRKSNSEDDDKKEEENNENSFSISIIDATVSATAVHDELSGGGGAGIGGGARRKNGGTITIKDSNVSAFGSCGGAGIGSGFKGSIDSVKITRSSIISKGKYSDNSSKRKNDIHNEDKQALTEPDLEDIGGSGIGGGYFGSCPQIEIFESTIQSEGGKGASGIGSAQNNRIAQNNVIKDDKNDDKQSAIGIKIERSKVTAIGGRGGAGIGSGNECTENNNMRIIVDDSIINTIGGKGAAGIGGGIQSDKFSIIIKDSQVTSKGGSSYTSQNILGSGAGIGNGQYGQIFSSISIEKSQVLTEGGDAEGSFPSGSGIGAGSFGLLGKISIDESDVFSMCGKSQIGASGIGGSLTDEAVILIEKSKVAAIGGTKTPGIGGTESSKNKLTVINSEIDCHSQLPSKSIISEINKDDEESESKNTNNDENANDSKNDCAFILLNTFADEIDINYGIKIVPMSGKVKDRIIDIFLDDKAMAISVKSKGKYKIHVVDEKGEIIGHLVHTSNNEIFNVKEKINNFINVKVFNPNNKNEDDDN